MEWFYKVISRVEFYVLLLLIAVIAAFFAIFRDLPHSGNAYSPTVRDRVLVPLLLVGITLFLASIAAFFLRRLDSRASGPMKLFSRLRFQPKPTEPGGDIESEKRVIDAYKGLSKTQQRVVSHLCEMPPTQMTVDDFFLSFTKRYGADYVASVSEVYFRLEVLSLKGLCRLDRIAPGASIAVRITEVSRCLREKDLLVS